MKFGATAAKKKKKKKRRSRQWKLANLVIVNVLRKLDMVWFNFDFLEGVVMMIEDD